MKFRQIASKGNGLVSHLTYKHVSCTFLVLRIERSGEPLWSFLCITYRFDSCFHREFLSLLSLQLKFVGLHVSCFEYKKGLFWITIRHLFTFSSFLQLSLFKISIIMVGWNVCHISRVKCVALVVENVA